METTQIYNAQTEIKNGVSAEHQRELEEEIKERSQLLNTLKSHSAKFEEDPRYRKDVQSGKSKRLARRKWKSRVRATKHRVESGQKRAAENVELSAQWLSKFRGGDVETREQGIEARREYQYDRQL